MGLVRNLKKRLNNWVEVTLAELCYLYITQKEKQTLRRPGNSSTTTSLQKHLTTELPCTTIATSSQGTSEKITMKTLKTTEDIVSYIRDWSVDKIEEVESIGDKAAIYAEFEEWIELDSDDEDIEIVSLEPED